MFITKVSAAVQVLTGMILLETNQYSNIFDMPEGRIATLKRANDIMQKVKVLFNNYSVELICACH